MNNQPIPTPTRLWTMPPALRDAYRNERRQAADATDTAADVEVAWRHLDRAHILAQPFPIAHTGSHWTMLRLAVRRRDRHEAVGQIVRLAVAGIASIVGRIPVGNTGRANVPLRATMPIPDDLSHLLKLTIPQPTPPTPARARRRLATAIIAATGLTALASCGGSGDAAELVGYEIDPAPFVGDLDLADSSRDGADTPIVADPGELLIVFLGFTNCPDACPATLSTIAASLNQLDDDAADTIDVAMITVDPERDSLGDLAAYLEPFAANTRAMRTGDLTELRTVADRFGASFDTATHDHDGSVEVGHTDHTYVVDDTGTVILTWTIEMNSDQRANDLKLILERKD